MEVKYKQAKNWVSEFTEVHYNPIGWQLNNLDARTIVPTFQQVFETDFIRALCAVMVIRKERTEGLCQMKKPRRSSGRFSPGLRKDMVRLRFPENYTHKAYLRRDSFVPSGESPIMMFPVPSVSGQTPRSCECLQMNSISEPIFRDVPL